MATKEEKVIKPPKSIETTDKMLVSPVKKKLMIPKNFLILLLVCVITIPGAYLLYRSFASVGTQSTTATNTVDSINYPRTVEYWKDYTAAERAKVDLLIMEPYQYPTETNAVRALNPATKIMLYEDIVEFDYNANVAPTEYVNERLNEGSTDWILTQVGTTLSASVDATTTTIPVTETTKLNGTTTVALFKIGELALVDHELMKITAVGTNTITVQRGVVKKAAVHAAGVRTAACVTFWPGSVVTDMTKASLAVDLGTGFGPETYYQWRARVTGTRAVTEKWDGVYMDRADGNESWVISTGYARSFDQARTNTFVSDKYAAFNTSWNDGEMLYYKALRAKVGVDMPIFGNRAITGSADINGSLMEGFPDSQISSKSWHDMIVGPNLVAGRDVTGTSVIAPYFNWVKNSRDPKLNIINTYEYEDGTSTTNPFIDPNFKRNYQKMRFGLTTTLLGNGYYGHFSGITAKSNGFAWFDEYDNAGAGKGYLGQPIGDAYQVIPSLTTPDLVNGTGTFNTQAQLDSWELYNRAGYASTKTLDSGAAKINITAAAGSFNGVGFSYQPFPITVGVEYTLTFRAKADKVVNIYASAEKNNPWGFLAEYDDLGLTTDWQTFNIPVKAIDSSTTGTMNFLLGGTTGTIWLDDVKLQEGNREVYRRDFTNGISLVNPTESAVTIPLGGNFRKIKGTQVPSINDGSIVSSVTLQPKDGIILLRESVPISSPTVAPTATPTPTPTPTPTITPIPTPTKVLTPTPTITPMAVSISSPLSGGKVSTTSQIIKATVTGPYAVKSVVFYIDGVVKSTVTKSPYSYTWKTTSVTRGTHIIKVQATDSLGRTAYKQIIVTK
ncbi:MAG: Ig-like domain-containing protein [bacterium]